MSKRAVTIIYADERKIEKSSVREAAHYLIKEIVSKAGIIDLPSFDKHFQDVKFGTFIITHADYEDIVNKRKTNPNISNRYYKEPIEFGGEKYHITAEWGASGDQEKFTDLKDKAERELECNIVVDPPSGSTGSYTASKATAAGTSGSPSTEDIIDEMFKNSEKKQLILTGAPGTGKTYSAIEYAKDKKADYEFVQFHPSYDYTDFVEGLRPIESSGSGSGIQFVKMDGTFKAFCRKIVEANNKKKKGKKKSDISNNEDKVEYDKYYFIIDEINRADLSKVFGELMYGLEYRGESYKFKTQYQNLPTYKSDGTEISAAADVFFDGFFIPDNLYIIGTMNDIDRSVESFDFALRRRFDWIEIKANDVMENVINSMLGSKTVKPATIDRISDMNKKISGSGSAFGLTEAYHIGPAYFKGFDPSDEQNSLEKIFDYNIAPILREYTRGRNSERVRDFLDECRNALLGE